MRPQNRKIHSKGRPLQQTKNYNCIYLSNQHRFGTVALPVAKTKFHCKTLRFCKYKKLQKTNLNTVPKMGPPDGPNFCDRMHSLVKEQKKSTFTVPFLGPSGGAKNETAKSQNPQQRPALATNKKLQLKPKLCVSATLIQKTSKNEPKRGPKNGTARRSHFWDRTRSLVKEQKKSTFTVPFLGPSGGTKMRPQNRKIHNKGQPLQQTKNYNCIYLSNQHSDLEQLPFRSPPSLLRAAPLLRAMFEFKCPM